MSLDVMTEICKIVNEEREAVSQELTRGLCKDYADYKYLCGRVGAFAYMSNVLNDLQKKLDGEE